MGYTQGHKAASRERIVDVTARRIREQGTERPTIAELVREAGLTHGGFYKHFDSRDELIAEAVGRAMGSSGGRLGGAAAASDDPLSAVADAYLSRQHRDAPGDGCGLPALGAEIPRIGEDAREAYRVQVERYADLLESLDDLEDSDGRRRALVTLSAMVGAVVVSRALGATAASDEVLDAVRSAIGERGVLAPQP